MSFPLYGWKKSATVTTTTTTGTTSGTTVGTTSGTDPTTPDTTVMVSSIKCIFNCSLFKEKCAYDVLYYYIYMISNPQTFSSPYH